MKQSANGKTNIHVLLPTPLMKEVNTWRHLCQIDSLTQAIERLLEYGLDAVIEKNIKK